MWGIITDYKSAGVIWTKHTAIDPIAVKVLCKENGCLTKPPYEFLPWLEMRDYLLYLASNCGLSVNEHKAWAASR